MGRMLTWALLGLELLLYLVLAALVVYCINPNLLLPLASLEIIRSLEPHMMNVAEYCHTLLEWLMGATG